jgi:tetratricopeptide (TPR) repeat protein
MRRRFVRGLLKILQLILTIIIAIPFVIAFLVFINVSGIIGTKPLLLAIPAFLIFLYLNIFLHELGHVIAARLARIGISKVMIGTGREIVRTTILGFPWVITSNPMGGYTFPYRIEGRFLRLRLLLFVAGGTLFQAFCILLCIGLLQIDQGTFVIYKGVDLLTIFILSNLSVLFFSLVPMKAPYQGIKIPSDMLRIFKLLFGSNKALEPFQTMGLLDEAFRHFAEKDYEQAAHVFKQCIKKYPDHIIAKISLSAALIKLLRLQDAKELLIALIEEKHHDDEYYVLIYNNLAWVFLLENNTKTLVEADLYSKRAFEMNPDLPPIRGTRGCVLILQGTVDEGINLLLKNVHSRKPIDSKGNHPIWFCFIAYAYYLKGEKEKVRQYLEPIRDYQKWDPDEKYLYEVVKSKAEHFKEIFKDVDQLGSNP